MRKERKWKNSYVRYLEKCNERTLQSMLKALGVDEVEAYRMLDAGELRGTMAELNLRWVREWREGRKKEG